jgi:hypothetical protein
MDEEMDLYLSRCLKNWAARYQPPLHGKERLFKAIVSPRWMFARRSSGASQASREFQPSSQVVYLPGMMMRGSFTLSLAWPVHIASLVNVAQ